MRKRIIGIILAALAIAAIMQGKISKASPEYGFPNRDCAVESIVLLHNLNKNNQGTDESNMAVMKELNDDEITAFMCALYKLETQRCGTPPPAGYGEYVAKVTYQNGDIEMFGTLNIEYISNGAWQSGIGEYAFSGNDFEELFWEYANS